MLGKMDGICDLRVYRYSLHCLYVERCIKSVVAPGKRKYWSDSNIFLLVLKMSVLCLIFNYHPVHDANNFMTVFSTE